MGDRRNAGPQNDGDGGLVCREGNGAAPVIVTVCRGEFAPHQSARGLGAYCGSESANATHCATHSDWTEFNSAELTDITGANEEQNQ